MKHFKTRIFAILLAFCMLFSCVSVFAGNIDKFKDLDKNAWYAEAIEYILVTGIMNGTSENTFSPDDNLTRAMLVTILYRAGGNGEEAEETPFADVPEDAYYKDAVSWAKANKIVNGTSETEFSPDVNITREQIAAILFRFANFKGIKTEINGNFLKFPDAKDISAYAAEAMNWAVGNGFVTERKGGLLAPTVPAQRLETAVILYNFLTADHEYFEPGEIKPTPEGGNSKPSGGGAGMGGGNSKPEEITPPISPLPEALKPLKGSEKWQTKIDYSDSSNWLTIKDADKAVDVIYFYPTTFQKTGSDDVSDINDVNMRRGAAKAFSLQATVFENDCNIYAPFYRQVSREYAFGSDELMRQSAMQDPATALDYYFENYNNGKPFILAGHGQGSKILLGILADYMKNNPDYYKNMVAAYVLGCSVTKEFLSQNPHLKFAESATDTGVIISYTTEGTGNIGENNAAVSKGAIAINPVNWQRDNTYALALDNMGSLDKDGNVLKGFADAMIDTERGTVICGTASPSYKMDGTFFGPDSYFDYDYGFYYMNLRENAWRRIKAFGK